MTEKSDQETLAIILLNIHPAHVDLYRDSSYGSWRRREWDAAIHKANKIVAAGFSSVKFI